MAGRVSAKRTAAKPIKIALGKRIRARRLELQLSQEELAYIAGIHVTYLSGIERGERNPALENLCAVANALHVPLAKLLG